MTVSSKCSEPSEPTSSLGSLHLNIANKKNFFFFAISTDTYGLHMQQSFY